MSQSISMRTVGAIASICALILCMGVAKASAEEGDITGSWVMTVETPDGAGSEGEFTLTNTDGNYSAVWLTELGEGAFEEVSIEGDAISFSSTVDFGGVLVPISFAGTISADAINGIVNLEFDGQPLEMPTVGKRGGAEEMAAPDLPGEWEIEAELPDGSTSVSTLVVTEDGGILSAVMETELGAAAIEGIEVDGNSIGYTAQLDMGGVMVPLSVEGTASGDTMEGVVKLNFEGQEMELPFRGSKLGAGGGGLTGEVNLPGSWDMEAELPDGSTSASGMTVTEDAGVITATMVTEIGEASISGIAIDGNSISFETEIDMGGVLVPLSFAGSTGGDKIEGLISLDMDGQVMELPVRGTRTVDAGAEVATEEAPAEAEAPAEEAASDAASSAGE